MYSNIYSNTMMIMNSGTINDAPPVERALATVEVAMAELIIVLRDGGLDHHDQTGLLMLLDRAEKVRNQWQAVDVELLATCRDRKIAERECQRSMAKVLERRFLVAPSEARRRVLAAEAAGPRETPTGMPLPRVRAEVAAAMGVGAMTDRQFVEVNKTLDRLDRADLPADQVLEVESELVAHCRRFGPRELRTLCQRYLDALDPDGPEPDEQRNQDRRSWRMHTTASGAVVGEFRLTPETGAKVRAIFSSLSNPRVETPGGMATTDLRRHEQRLHDAFDDLCSRALRAGGLPDSGGTPATVIVTIDQADLLSDLARSGIFGQQPGPTIPHGPCPTCGREPASATRPDDDSHTAVQDPSGPTLDEQQGETHSRSVSPDPDPTTGRREGRTRPGRGVTSCGASLTVRQLLKLAGEAEIYPVVLTKHGKLLEMGRSRRIANKHQTLALIARDGGCSFPACDYPPEWCERHHILPWHKNGKTDLRNLTLLCSYHHSHFLDRGWQVRINTDGLPEWVPPRYLDSDQTPMINNRVIARIHQSPLLT